MSLANRLKKALGRTPASKLALASGITPTSVGKYLNGAIPNVDIAARIAKELKVNLLWLATGEGAMRGTTPEKKSTAKKIQSLNQQQLLEALLVANDINLNLSATVKSLVEQSNCKQKPEA